jgi:hypothetical protein
MADRVERLREAAQARHAETLRRAEAAISTLARRDETITLRGLATAAGVSRSWLYRQPQLRQEIDRLRQQPPRTSLMPIFELCRCGRGTRCR